MPFIIGLRYKRKSIFRYLQTDSAAYQNYVRNLHPVCIMLSRSL
ncbi:MAG: toxin YdaT domain-containing protein [Lachnospiraceae bacterium]|nr:toxin YdaT domain-containing protein [Lachnospiraceae bacterium]